MIKAEKYRTENIQIEHLFHPPTEAFKPWFTTLSLYLEDDINRRAAALTGDKAIALRMGSEVELNIFANTYDSSVHHRHSHTDNPNYTPKHRKTTDEIARDLCATKEEGGLNEILYENHTWLPTPIARKITKDTVFMELRTIPASVSGYIDQMEELGEWLQGEAYARGVRPVVHSQHIHFSLQGTDKNLFDRKEKTRKFVNKGLIDIYHRTLPLVRMPEEIEFSGQYDMEYSSSQNIKSKIGNDPRQQAHIEARVNNSEYAFDPYLNLLVQMLGIHRGISHKTKILGYSSLDRDYHLDSGESRDLP